MLVIWVLWQLVSLLCCLQLLACRPVLISRHLENLSEPPSAAWSALCSSVWVWLLLVVVVVSCMCVCVWTSSWSA